MLQLWFNLDGDKNEPLITICNDKNRSLMIKYKYDTITPSELNEFHNRIEKLIYKVIRKNFLMMDIKDIYQEVWRKICKCKHTWNENKGTMVSTWIVIVAQSVINSLRQNKNKYDSRYMCYEDLPDFVDAETAGEDKAVRFNSSIRDGFYRKEESNLRMKEFLEGLTDDERRIIDVIMTTGYDELNKCNNSKYSKSKITRKFIREKLDMPERELKEALSELQKKYHDLFECSDYE